MRACECSAKAVRRTKSFPFFVPFLFFSAPRSDSVMIFPSVRRGDVSTPRVRLLLHNCLRSRRYYLVDIINRSNCLVGCATSCSANDDRNRRNDRSSVVSREVFDPQLPSPSKGVRPFRAGARVASTKQPHGSLLIAPPSEFQSLRVKDRLGY